MRNRIEAGIAALALTAAALVANGSVGTAYGDEPCVPNDGTPAAFSEWRWASFTEWQTGRTPPADPDGQDGEDNPLNLTMIGEPEERTVESPGSPETTDWLLAPPAGDGWVQADQRTVVDVPGSTQEVFDHWQRYSWTGGPHAGDDPPSFPSVDWQPNMQGDPHGIGVEGAYFRSHGGSGKGEWFYLEAVTTTVEHPPVTHDEYRYERTVASEVTEYRWSVYTRTYTPGTAPVVCGPDEPQVDNPNPPSDNPSDDDHPVDNPPGDQHNPAVKQGQPPVTKPVVPTSIDAGL